MVKGATTPHNKKERSFTNEKVAKLLMGQATPHMRDLMIAALTGARLDAFVDLKVSDTTKRCPK